MTGLRKSGKKTRIWISDAGPDITGIYFEGAIRQNLSGPTNKSIDGSSNSDERENLTVYGSVHTPL
jgi:hypothetical protein